MNDRDMENQPYTDDENRVCKYLLEITHDQIGCGADQIGFLIASHGSINHTQKNQRAVIKALVDALARVIDNVETGSYESTGQDMHEARTALARAKELGDG